MLFRSLDDISLELGADDAGDEALNLDLDSTQADMGLSDGSSNVEEGLAIDLDDISLEPPEGETASAEGGSMEEFNLDDIQIDLDEDELT